MHYDGMWDELPDLLFQDEEYQYFLELAQDLEPDYSNILESLTEEQRFQLDAYIRACEAMDSIAICHAYDLGRKHASILIPPTKL